MTLDETQTSLKIRPLGDPISGEVRPHSDRMLTHLALVAGSLAVGTAYIRHPLESPEIVATRRILAHLGVSFSTDDDGWLVISKPDDKLKAPGVELDCGRSLITLRLMSGVLAGHPFSAELVSDIDFAPRMSAQIELLSQMGAKIECYPRDNRFYMRIRGNPLRPVTCELNPGAAEIKSAMLLAAMFAVGNSKFVNTGASSDHAERMIRSMGANFRRADSTLTLRGEQRIYPRWLKIPGDLTAASPFIILAALHPGSDLTVKEVGTNPGRSGLLKILARANADITREKAWQYGAEPVARINIKHSPRITPINVPPNLVPSMLGELPLITLLASQAEGTSHIKGISQLSGRMQVRPEFVAQVLRSFGVDIELDADGFTVHGPAKLTGAEVQCAGDQQISVLAVTAALLARGDSVIHGVDPSLEPYPGLLNTIANLSNCQDK